MKSLKIYLEECNETKAEFDRVYHSTPTEKKKTADFCTVWLMRITDFMQHSAKKITEQIEQFVSHLIPPDSQTVYTV